MEIKGYLMILMMILAVLAFGCKKINDDIVNGSAANASEKDSNTTLAQGNETGNSTEKINQLVLKEDTNLTAGNNETNLTSGNSSEEGSSTGIIESGDLIVNFIDVGYGDSIFIQTPANGTMLVDGGADDKGSVVISYLRSQGVSSSLDVMIGTHPDHENIGGLDSVSFNLASVGATYDNGYTSNSQSYEAFVELSKAKGEFKTLATDTSFKLKDNEKTTIQLIVPYADGFFNNSNDNSIVVKITYGNISFLLMGDCGFQCEKKIMGHDLKADVIKIAHNGINDSTSQEFLDEVKPRVAIISTGEHVEPSADVLQRLADNNIDVLRTDSNGTIVVKTDGKELSVRASK